MLVSAFIIRLLQTGDPGRNADREESPPVAPAGPGVRNPVEDRGPGVSLQGGSLVLSDPSGRVEWEMTVEQVEASTVSQSARISGVQAARYVDGRRAFGMVAGRATVEWAARKVFFDGGIRVEGASGARLDARRATWDGSRSLLEVEGDVNYRDGTTTLTGDRIVVDESLGRAKVVGRGRATVLVMK